MKNEKRLYPRCSTSEAEYRVFSHDTKIIGRLVNIGQKGLALRYTPKPGNRAKFTLIDIMGTGRERWHLPEVACERAYDISVLAENQSFTGSESRLCGLQFIQLTSKHKERLAILLGQCDAGPHNTILTRCLDRFMVGFDPSSGCSPAAG